MHRSSLSTAAIVVLTLLSFPASADSLLDAVRETLATHPRIDAASRSREAVGQELRQARGLFLPQVDVLVGAGGQNYDGATTRSNGTADKTTFRKEATVTVTQRLFDGFEAASEVERQKARVASSANRVAETAEFLGLDAINAYLDVWRQRRLLEIARDNVKVHQGMLVDLRQRASSGGGSVADVTHADARLARARATVLQTENDLRDAEALYQKIVGVKPGTLATPPLPQFELPTNEEGALRLVGGNPTVQIYGADAEAARHEVAVADAAYYPKVNFEASHERFWDADGVNDSLVDTKAMVRVRQNMYRGGQDVATRRAAAARESQARALLWQAGREAQEQMRRSWNAYDIAHQRIAVLKEAVKHTSTTRVAYRDQFRVAQRSLIEVLDAENEYFVAAGQLVTGEANRISASYRILATAGLLLSSMGLERPPAADPATPGFWEDVVR